MRPKRYNGVDSMVVYGMNLTDTGSTKTRRAKRQPISNSETMYKSALGQIKALKDWERDAIEFYRICEIKIPSDWFDRWTKILKLELL